jgi:hypothetical protein
MTIICKRCGEDKDESLFPKDKSRPTGYHTYCKSCKSQEERARQKAKLEAKFDSEESNFRVCATCGENKHRAEYHQSVFSRQNCKVSCKICNAATKPTREKKPRATIYRDAIKLFLMERLGSKCKRCGLEPSEMFPPACFDFHHKDESSKEFSVANRLHKLAATPEVLLAEVDKCDLLCSNCHRAIHHSK